MQSIFKGRILIIYIVVLVSVIVIFFIRYERQFTREALALHNEYPSLLSNQSLSSRVVHKICDRGQALLTFSDSTKFWIEHSRNYDYDPEWICEFIRVNDILVKKPQNDSLFIHRGNSVYFFVLGKYINEK